MIGRKYQLLKNLGLSSGSVYGVASNNQPKDQIQSLRNIDYRTERGNAILEYNQAIKMQKQRFNYRLKQYQNTKQKSNDQSQLKQLQLDQSKYLDHYMQRLNSLGYQFNNRLTKINLQEETNTVKLYLADHMPAQKASVQNRANIQQKSGSFIPNGLILKKLYLTEQKKAREVAPNQQILLAGLEKDQQHSMFISRLIEELDIRQVITMLAPDLPYFIKTQKSFIQEWKLFIRDTDYAKKSKFYVNPKPRFLRDVCLNQHHLSVVRQSLARSQSFLQTYYCMHQYNQLTVQYQPNPLLAGFFSHNVEKIYFAEYPAFEQRKMMANLMSIDLLRKLFQQHLANFLKGKTNFSAQWLFPKQVLSRKLNHLIGAARAVAESSEGRSIILCPAEMAELISIEWQLRRKESQLRYQYNDGNYYFDFDTKQFDKGQQTFIQFVQKLVILDLIIEPIITKYFVKQRSFPYLCAHTAGAKQHIGKVFIVWMHFYKIYYDLLSDKMPDGTYRNSKKMKGFEDPSNFQ